MLLHVGQCALRGSLNRNSTGELQSLSTCSLILPLQTGQLDLYNQSLDCFLWALLDVSKKHNQYGMAITLKQQYLHEFSQIDLGGSAEFQQFAGNQLQPGNLIEMSSRHAVPVQVRWNVLEYTTTTRMLKSMAGPTPEPTSQNMTEETELQVD